MLPNKLHFSALWFYLLMGIRRAMPEGKLQIKPITELVTHFGFGTGPLEYIPAWNLPADAQSRPDSAGLICDQRIIVLRNVMSFTGGLVNLLNTSISLQLRIVN